MKKPKLVGLHNNFTGISTKEILSVIALIFGIGATYGALAFKVNAQEAKVKSLTDLVPSLATKDDVREVRKDFRTLALALGHGLPPLPLQRAPSVKDP